MSGLNRFLTALSPPLPGRVWLWALLAGLLCAAVTGSVVLAQSGSTYDLHWNVLTNGGSLASGTNYRINYSFGQPSTIQQSAGTVYQAGQGYWYGGSAPTPVELASFDAAAHGRDVRVVWETASEIDLVGFNLYRATSPDGPYVQVNGKLIPAENPGSPFGDRYVWWDRGMRLGRTYYYKLEQVGIGGETTMHGPISVRLRRRIGR